MFHLLLSYSRRESTKKHLGVKTPSAPALRCSVAPVRTERLSGPCSGETMTIMLPSLVGATPAGFEPSVSELGVSTWALATDAF